MFKSFALIITVGMAIGAIVWVKWAVADLRQELEAAERIIGLPGLVHRPTLEFAGPSPFGAADHLFQIAKDCQVSGEQLHAFAQNAALDCAGSTCIDVMFSLWGPDWSERVMRESDLGSNG